MSASRSESETREPHRLKCWQPYFAEVVSGRKTFEVRRDDRGYQERDTLVLCEWTGTRYTGSRHVCQVVFLLGGLQAEMFGLRPGYVVMGLTALSPFPPTPEEPA